MVQPTLWGPAAWQMLFMCTWNCSKRNFSKLTHLVECTGELLPCCKCRNHFARNRLKVNRRTKGIPDEPRKMFYWLYCLKDEINKELRISSISFEDLTERCVYHGAVVDDVRIGDMLVIFAISANILEKHSLFIDMCELVADLLPLPSDSELVVHLRRIRSAFLVADTVKAARAARIERGLQPLTTGHYKSLVVD